MIRLHLACIWRGPPPDDLQRELDDDDLPKRAAEALGTTGVGLSSRSLAPDARRARGRRRVPYPPSCVGRPRRPARGPARRRERGVDRRPRGPAGQRAPAAGLGTRPGAVGLHLAGPRGRPRPHREPQHHLWGTRHRRGLARRGAGNPGRRLASLLWRILRAGEVASARRTSPASGTSPSAVSVVEACRRQTDPADPEST
jgi:hypothetical protein